MFDVADPLKPRFIRQVPLATLDLPPGKLRNKKSINLVYIRRGHDPLVREIAEKILATQVSEIEGMRRRLDTLS